MYMYVHSLVQVIPQCPGIYGMGEPRHSKAVVLGVTTYNYAKGTEGFLQMYNKEGIDVARCYLIKIQNGTFIAGNLCTPVITFINKP